MNSKNLKAQKVSTSALVLAVTVLIFGNYAQADTELRFEQETFYGGLGDQSGNAVQFKDGRLYAAGVDIISSPTGLGISFTAPAADLPVSNFSWADSQKSAVSVSTAFNDLTVSSDGLYFAGSSLAKLSGKKTTQELSGVLTKFSLNATKTSAPLWVVRSGFFPDRKEEVLRAVMAADDGIYVAGHASSRVDNTTAMLAKYDTKGNLLWSKTLGDTGELKKSGGTALAVLNGYIYVAGFTSSEGKKFNTLPLKAALWKYDSSGNQVWMKSASPELYVLSGSDNTTYGVKVDVAASDSYLYMTSAKKATKDSDGNVLLAKYDENGKLIWENRWTAESSAGDTAKYSWTSGITAGRERLYVVGYMEYKTKKGDEDSFLIEVDKDYGSVLAVHTYGELDKLEDALEITVAGTDVYTVGVRKPFVQDKKDPSNNMDLSLLRYIVLPITKVTIDIEPGTSQNVIDPDAKEVELVPADKKKKAVPPKEKEITVAILSSKEFNAATQVNLNSLTFGRTGNEASWSSCTAKDVNQDGSLDLLCYFKPSWIPWKESKFTFEVGDTQGILKGQMISGARFIGKDSVRIGGASSVPAPEPLPAPVPAPILTTTPTPPPAPTTTPLTPAPSTTTDSSAPTTPTITSLISQPSIQPAPAPVPTTTSTPQAPASEPVTTVMPAATPAVTDAPPVISQPSIQPAPTTTESTTSTPTPVPTPVSQPSASEPAPLTATVMPTTPVATDAPVISQPSIQPAPATTTNSTMATTASTPSPFIFKPLASTSIPPSTVTTSANTQTSAVYQPIYTSQPTAVVNQNTAPVVTPAAPLPSPSASSASSKQSLSAGGSPSALSLVSSATAHQKTGALYSPETILKSEAAPEYREEELMADLETNPIHKETPKSGSGLAKAYGDLGKKALQQGKLSEAISYYNDALKLDPHTPDVHVDLGLALIQQGDLKEAAAHFSEALELNPNDKTARENLDLVLAKLGQSKIKPAEAVRAPA